MGTVWLAEHQGLETHVVVKLMTKEVAGNAVGAARFAREAAIASAVKSPHVVQVFDTGVTPDGIAFIVMELLEGHDLGAHLTARGRMTPHEVGTLVTQLAKALAKAHRVGVVHRDLKPENVFLCDVEGGDPFVKLLDFGTAKEEQHAPFATATGELIGTPYYMSPEQILGEEVDARTDIWSLGVLAFEALTGARPFEGATVGAITLAIHTTTPRLTDVVPELPVALDEWFARACARAPADRYADAKTAGDAFARAVTGEPMSADSSPEPVFELAAVHVDRVATSLSSTLSSPRHERRTMTWIASGVFAASVLGMLAFFAHEDSRAAKSVASSFTSSAAPSTAAAPSPAVSASAPAPVASATATIVAPPAVASATAVSSSATTSPSVAAASTSSSPAPSAQSAAATPSTSARSATATPARAPSGRATAAASSFGPLPTFPEPSAASPFPRPSATDVGSSPTPSAARAKAAPAKHETKPIEPTPAERTPAEPAPSERPPVEPAPAESAPAEPAAPAAPEPAPAAPSASPSSSAPAPAGATDLFPDRR